MEKENKKEYALPEVLNDLLKANNMKQKELAEKLCVSFTTVSKWIMFDNIPSLYYVMHMAEIFNVSLDYLVYGSERAADE